MSTKTKFLNGFHKIAATQLPRWLREAHLSIDPRKSMPGFSKKKTGLRAMLKHRKVSS